MKNRSRESHDNTMYNVHDLEFWKKHNQEHIDQVFNNEELKVGRLLEKKFIYKKKRHRYRKRWRMDEQKAI